MSILNQMISNVLETRFETIPSDVIKRAKDEVIDVIGCALGGANDTGCPEILALMQEWGGAAESTILAHGFKAPSHNVAFINTVMARSFDFGIVDAYMEGEVKPAHIGETLVPTALAIAEARALTGKQLLTSLVLGEDLTSRIMFSSGSPGSWDFTGTLNTFGSTAVAGRLLGLNPIQLVDAFGIALNQIGGSAQNLNEKVHCFKLGQGLAAQRGIFSAKLAAKGFTGVVDPLTGSGGYFSLYSTGYDPAVITRHLGEQFYTEITFKPYPCCRGTHAAVESALKISQNYPLKPEDIREVNILIQRESFPRVIRESFSPGRVPHVDAIFSLQYTVASALLRGQPIPQHFTDSSIQDHELQILIAKTRVTTTEFPGETFLASGVDVTLKDGKVHSSHVSVPKGNELVNPLTPAEKQAKFINNAQFSGKISQIQAHKAYDMLYHLEEIQDINAVIALLVPD